MINDLTLLIALLLFCCMALLIVLLVRQNAGLRRQEEARLRQEHGLENLGNQLLDELDAQRDQTVDSLYQGNQHLMNTLSQISQTQSTLLENMLASVYKGMGEMQSVAAGVTDLKKVMTNVKTRGIWGEMQLGNLIRQTLSPDQYAENVEVVPGSRERVEFALRLPDRDGVSVWLGRRFLEMILQQVSHDVRTAVTDRIQDPRGIGREGSGGGGTCGGGAAWPVGSKCE